MTILYGQGLVDRARELAYRLHEGSYRKGGDGKTPYIEHPRAVEAELVASWLGALSISDQYRARAVAWSHDLVEDVQGVTLQVLADQGLGAITTQLDLLTHRKGTETYLAYLLRIRRSGDRIALAVKLADLTANSRDTDSLPRHVAKTMLTKFEMARYILQHP